MGDSVWTVRSHSPEETRALGCCLAAAGVSGTVVALEGDLGAGKTCLAQGVGEALGVQEPVVSPTFVLVAEYEAPLPLLHADAYRLEPGEVASIGLEETLEDWPGLALVEWPGKVPEALPLDHVEVCIRILGEERLLEVDSTGPRSAAVVRRWQAAWSAWEHP